MKVEYKGQMTAIKRKNPSLPMRWLFKRGLLYPNGIFSEILDYGCGKGFDALYFGMDKYDPHYHPCLIPKKKYEVITCNYVLNVVPSQDVDGILKKIKGLLVKGGKAYISVRRDLPKNGKAGRGVWQKYVELPLPILEENSTFCIYEVTNGKA